MASRHYFFLLLFAVFSAAANAAEHDDLVLPSSIQAEPEGRLTWATRVEVLDDEMKAGEKMSADADVLYLELHEVWLRRQRQLQWVLSRVHSPSDPVDILPGEPTEETTTTINVAPIQKFETVRDLYDELIDLYLTRIRLLDLVTPSLRTEITGLDRYGAQELKAELNFIIQVVRFQGLGSEFVQQLQRAPFLLLTQFLQIILVILVFRWWRSWLPPTLSRMRAAMMEIRPRSSAVVRRLKLLWHIDQARSPIEWLILFLVMSSVFDIEGLRFEEDLIRIVLQWAFLGWFAVSITNAVVTRGQPALTGGVAKIRLRSFRLLTVWLVFLGLGLQLTADLAGTATLYAWVWRAFEILSIPVFIVLLVWWRPEIFRRLSIHPERTKTIERKLKYQTGLRGTLNAMHGIAFLITSGLRRFLLRQVARLGTTNILDSNVTYGIGAKDPTTNGKQGSSIDESTRNLFLTLPAPYQRYMRAELRTMTARAKGKRGGVIAVIGERGGGKSVFLQRLASELKGQMLILESGFGGYPELEQSLVKALDCGSDPVTPRQISERLENKDIRVIAIDDGHHLVRPVIGGHHELDRMTDFVNSVTGKVLWLITFDRYAAQLALRVRAGQEMVDDLLKLPLWTHDQISELINQRCDAAGITLDFEDLAIPSEYLETTYENTKDRNRAAIYRMISSLSEGNPTVALQCWLDCLHHDENSDRLVVKLPSRRTDRGLDAAAANHELLLVLRVIAQSEPVSLDDIVENLGFSTKIVTAKLFIAMSRGWVEKVEDRYRLSWTWFRTITQVLRRRNMLVR